MDLQSVLLVPFILASTAYNILKLQLHNFTILQFSLNDNMLLYMFGMREKVVLQVTIGFMHCWLYKFQGSQI